MEQKFTTQELMYAKEFAVKAKLTNPDYAEITSIESEDDSINIGVFCITKVSDTKVTRTILGEKTTPIISFAVTTEMQEYSSEWGYSSDVCEVGRSELFWDALRLCAHVELDWSLDGLVESILN